VLLLAGLMSKVKRAGVADHHRERPLLCLRVLGEPFFQAPGATQLDKRVFTTRNQM